MHDWLYDDDVDDTGCYLYGENMKKRHREKNEDEKNEVVYSVSTEIDMYLSRLKGYA